jgi:hypothetical protein
MTTSQAINPAAVAHQPFFITAPGQTDTLLIAMGIFVVLFVVMIGLVYFRLHALPEHIAHSGKKIQFEIVAILGLLSLFTHNHIFWIAGLLLAFVQFPDFLSPLQEMSKSLKVMSGRKDDEPQVGILEAIVRERQHAPAEPATSQPPAPAAQPSGDVAGAADRPGSKKARRN